MNSTTDEDVVFGTLAGCTLVVAVAVCATLITGLITLAAPLLESMARAAVLR